MSKVNSGNFEKSYSGEHSLINTTLRMSADKRKVRLDTINMGRDYFSGLSIILKNSTGLSMGEICVNLEKLETLLDTFENGRDITINMDGDSEIIINDGKRKGRCPVLFVANRIPLMPSLSVNSSSHTILASVLKEMLGKVKHAIAPKDEVRQIFRGVNMSINPQNELTLACADGKRLAMDSCKMMERETDSRFEVYKKDKKKVIKEAVNVIIPERTMTKLLKLLEGTVKIRTQTEASPSGIEISFSGENYEAILYSSLITGKFPNFNNVFPSVYDGKIEVNKKEITHILKGHKKFTDRLYKLDGNGEENSFRTSLKIDGNILNVISGHPDHGIVEYSLGVKTERKRTAAKKININTRYLLEGIQEVYGDTITMKFNGEFSPVVVTGKNGYQSVIMPIKLNSNR